MHFNSKLFLTLLATISTIFAATNDKCSGRSGICISTSTCSNYGGTSYTGKCPNDPNDVRCCDNIPCTADGKSGNCVFTSQCDGETYSGKCPGGNDFKCCVGKIKEIDTTYNGPCTEEVVLALILIKLNAILKLLQINAQVQITLDVVLQEINLHGILTKVNTPKFFSVYLDRVLNRNLYLVVDVAWQVSLWVLVLQQTNLLIQKIYLSMHIIKAIIKAMELAMRQLIILGQSMV